MMTPPKLGAPMAPAAQPVAAPAQPLTIGPEISRALQQIAQGMQGGVPGAPVDKNSPEYKQAMMQQLATTPMGAAGAVMGAWGDAYNKKQTQKQNDMNAWMPTITMGG